MLVNYLGEGEKIINYLLKLVFICIFSSLIFPNSKNIYNYKIKFYGLNVANCKVIYSDTLISNMSAKKIEYKVEKTGIIHVGVAKMSFDAKQITENVSVFIDTISV